MSFKRNENNPLHRRLLSIADLNNIKISDKKYPDDIIKNYCEWKVIMVKLSLN